MWARRLVAVAAGHCKTTHQLVGGRRAPSHRLLSTNNSSSNPSRSSGSLWQSLKAPALFGAGLYLGLVAFGEHQETKAGSAYFAGLRDMFWGGEEGGESNTGDSSDASASEKGER
ncbi:hypothetical protein ACHAXT_009890 [Thalassiosira profunda]